MNEITLTPDQQAALDAIGKYKILFLSGSAGSGKSEVIAKKMKSDTSGTIILCATTNRATRVLREKLGTGKKIQTVHSILSLKPNYDGSTKNKDELIEFTFSSSAKEYVTHKGKHLIIDEASMICRDIQTYIYDLIRYGNLESVTYVGDAYQLQCVKKEPFEYDKVDRVIELTQVLRSKGSLADYYNQIREETKQDKELSLYENGIYFDNKSEFVKYINEYQGSKVVISWTNQEADSFSKLLDSDELFEGQICSCMGHCSYKHKISSESLTIHPNSTIKIEKIFRSYIAMKRDSINNEYEYMLPNELVNLKIDVLLYAKVTTEDDKLMYISIWNASQDSKESLYLNKMTREYRKLQDSVKHLIAPSIWAKYAKEDGYLKSLSMLRRYFSLPKHVITLNEIFWNNFHAITNAISLRTIISTTAHRAQGLTIDVAGINYQDLVRCKDSKLMYVALTRASKELVFFMGEHHANI